MDRSSKRFRDKVVKEFNRRRWLNEILSQPSINARKVRAKNKYWRIAKRDADDVKLRIENKGRNRFPQNSKELKGHGDVSPKIKMKPHRGLK